MLGLLGKLVLQHVLVVVMAKHRKCPDGLALLNSQS